MLLPYSWQSLASTSCNLPFYFQPHRTIDLCMCVCVCLFLCVCVVNSKRPTAQMCTDSPWIKKACTPRSSALRPKPIATARLADFVERRKHQVGDIIKKWWHYGWQLIPGVWKCLLVVTRGSSKTECFLLWNICFRIFSLSSPWWILCWHAFSV